MVVGRGLFVKHACTNPYVNNSEESESCLEMEFDDVVSTSLSVISPQIAVITATKRQRRIICRSGGMNSQYEGIW